jgi:copper chaperone CopZ
MKKIKILLILSTIFLNIIEISAKDFPDSVYVKADVDGLSCPFCAYGMEKKIGELEGVENLFISLDGFVTFNTAKKDKVGEKVLKNLIEDAGFTLRKVDYSKKPFKKIIKNKKEKEDENK